MLTQEEIREIIETVPNGLELVLAILSDPVMIALARGVPIQSLVSLSAVRVVK
jgi:hypothetical protein